LRDLHVYGRIILSWELKVDSTRPDITAGLPKTKLHQLYILQMPSAETLPILENALMKLTLGWSELCIWVFIAKVTDEFILGRNIL
jgi:hypothetical protein